MVGEQEMTAQQTQEDSDVNAAQRVRRETLQQLEAFERYYSMKPRGLRRLAIQLRKNPSTLFRWAKSFGWIERCRQRDQEAAQIFKEHMKDEVLKQNQWMWGVWKKLAYDMVDKDSKELKIKVGSVNDFALVTKNLLLLTGQVTERVETTVTFIIDAVVRAANRTIDDGQLKLRFLDCVSEEIGTGATSQIDGTDEGG